MRLTNMTLSSSFSSSRVFGSVRVSRLAVAVAALALVMPGAFAQKTAGQPQTQPFKDTSMIKPPAGSKVCIYEFEDLECPACARAHPMVMAAIDHYKIPFIRKDYPLGAAAGHIWSTDAAIWARYMQDKISPKVAADYRTAVFAAQTSIASKDDLTNYTRKFLQARGQQVPFVVDPTGQFRKEIMEDHAVGEKLGLSQTPTLFVASEHSWVLVTDPTQLYHTIEQMLAEVGKK